MTADASRDTKNLNLKEVLSFYFKTRGIGKDFPNFEAMDAKIDSPLKFFEESQSRIRKSRPVFTRKADRLRDPRQLSSDWLLMTHCFLCPKDKLRVRGFVQLHTVFEL